MMESILEEINSTLPWTISNASWTGDHLSLFGEKWSFNTPSVWRASQGRIVHVACYDTRSVNYIDSIRGQKVVGVALQSKGVPVDPILQISNGDAIEIFSTDTYEPWVLQLPNGAVFVAAPGDKDPFCT
ncbi:MAG: hypothetical protein ACIAQF_02375 [Phycisphaerales bacterium JB065]